MNIFQEIKTFVSAGKAAEQYGIKINRNKMACCPFHNDRHPSMKIDQNYFCFACGAKGDVIDFTARLFGISQFDAARKLIGDFGLPIKLEKHKNTILSGAEDIVNTVYPGFMEKLVKKSGVLTRKDLLIIILTVCGFSSDGICRLTGIKTESLAVYRSNINRKMGWSGKLSDNLFRIISEDFH